MSRSNVVALTAGIAFVLIVLAGDRAHGDDAAQPDLYRAVTTEMAHHFDPNYLTLLGGYDRSGNIHPGTLFYEAQIALHLKWYENCQDSDSCGNKDFLYRVYVPIRLHLRQFQCESSPVKTPSYNPGVRVFFWPKSWMKSRDDFHYLSAGFHHYSNGQSKDHYVKDRINTDDGSFSSDYVELSYYKEKGVYWGKVNVRKYLTSLTWENAQDGFYETALLELTGKRMFAWQDASVQVTMGYKHGRKYVTSVNNASFRDNMQYSGQVIIPVPNWGWQDLKWYARWDKGYDYYNIYYENKINRLQIGFAATY